MEYRIDTKIRNNLLLSAIEAKGYSCGNIFAGQVGIPYASLLALVNMTVSPYLNNGELRPSVEKLCVFLGVMPCELFNEQQRERPVKSNKSVRLASASELEHCLADHRPDKHIELTDLRAETERLLDMCSDREQDIIERCVMGDETMTSVAESHGISPGRVEQIRSKALRRMRDPKRRGSIEEHIRD